MTHENRRIQPDLKRKKAQKRLSGHTPIWYQSAYRNPIGFSTAKTVKKREKNGPQFFGVTEDFMRFPLGLTHQMTHGLTHQMTHIFGRYTTAKRSALPRVVSPLLKKSFSHILFLFRDPENVCQKQPSTMAATPSSAFDLSIYSITSQTLAG